MLDLYTRRTNIIIFRFDAVRLVGGDSIGEMEKRWSSRIYYYTFVSRVLVAVWCKSEKRMLVPYSDVVCVGGQQSMECTMFVCKLLLSIKCVCGVNPHFVLHVMGVFLCRPGAIDHGKCALALVHVFVWLFLLLSVGLLDNARARVKRWFCAGAPQRWICILHYALYRKCLFIERFLYDDDDDDDFAACGFSTQCRAYGCNCTICCNIIPYSLLHGTHILAAVDWHALVFSASLGFARELPRAFNVRHARNV